MELKLISENFSSTLLNLEERDSNILRLSKDAIILAQKTLHQMLNIINEKNFNSIEAEVDFFKNIKTIPLSNLIYYKTIGDFEYHFPIISSEKQKKYMKKHLIKLEQFFNRHLDFGQYIEMESTHLDEHYFTRKSEEPRLLYNTFINIDAFNFSTPKGLLLSQFKANGKLVVYLREKLHSLSASNSQNFSERKTIKWTGNKIDLIELIYALHSSGSIQDRTGIKEVASACEELFDIKLGNYYRKFIELRSRKLIERTRFIDNLKSGLIRRMEEADE